MTADFTSLSAYVASVSSVLFMIKAGLSSHHALIHNALTESSACRNAWPKSISVSLDGIAVRHGQLPARPHVGACSRQACAMPCCTSTPALAGHVLASLASGSGYCCSMQSLTGSQRSGTSAWLTLQHHYVTVKPDQQLLCNCLREAYAAFDKLLLESAAKAAGTVVSCPACGDYSEYQPDGNDADGFPLQPVQLFRCIKCLQVTAAAAAAASGICCCCAAAAAAAAAAGKVIDFLSV